MVTMQHEYTKIWFQNTLTIIKLGTSLIIY